MWKDFFVYVGGKWVNYQAVFTCMRANVWMLTLVTPHTLSYLYLSVLSMSLVRVQGCVCCSIFSKRSALSKCGRTFQAEAHLISLDAHSLKGWRSSCFLPSYIICVKRICAWCLSMQARFSIMMLYLVYKHASMLYEYNPGLPLLSCCSFQFCLEGFCSYSELKYTVYWLPLSTK